MVLVAAAGVLVCAPVPAEGRARQPAPRAGTIPRVMVEDGQPVEYGEPLMIIE